MNVTIVGLGLIGGSFLKAAQAAGHTVTALHHGDRLPTTHYPLASINCHLILVCLPPEAIVPWVREHAPEFPDGAIVVDICGVKRPIMAGMRELLRSGEVEKWRSGEVEKWRSGEVEKWRSGEVERWRSGEVEKWGSGEAEKWTFVGGHPMAGREVSGFANSKSDLFVGASMILTPFEGTDTAVIETLKAFFASVGFAETVVTTPEKHDDMIAFTSQLCHVIATTYSRDRRVKDAIGFSAGSYANMTRIATQDAAVWSSLYRENRDALVGVLDDFAARFRELRDAIAAGDTEAMKVLIDEGTKAKRQELLDRKRGDESS